MSLEFLDSTTSYRYALEAQDMEEANVSWGGALGYGLASAGISAGVSFVNTAAAAANIFGADFERIETQDVVSSAFGNDIGNWYQENQTAIDMAGLFMGAVVPGLGGVRLARAAQSGLSRYSGSSKAVLGLRKAAVPKNQIASYRKRVMQGNVTASDFNFTMDAAKQGLHQNAVESLFAEAAVLTTMNQNPLLSEGDLDYTASLIDNTFSWGALLGIGIGTGAGGVVSTVSNRKALQAIVAAPHIEAQKVRAAFQSLPKHQKSALPSGDAVVNLVGERQRMILAIEGAEEGSQPRPVGEVKLLKEKLIETDKRVDEWISVVVDHPEMSKEFNNVMASSLRKFYADNKETAEGLDAIHTMFSGLQRASAIFDDSLSDVSLLPIQVGSTKELAEYADKVVNQQLRGTALTERMNRLLISQRKSIEDPTIAGFTYASTGARGLDSDFSLMPPAYAKTEYRSVDEVAFTVRHELSHLRTDELADKYRSYTTQRVANMVNLRKQEVEQNPYFNNILNQAEEVSRKMRPDSWRQSDLKLAQAKKRIESMDKKRKAGSYISPQEWEDHASAVGKLLEDAEYMYSPEELFADVGAAFTSESIEIWSGRLKELYSLFYKNDAALKRYGPNHSVMDLKTGRLYEYQNRVPTIADTGKVEVKGNSVIHAKGTTDTTKRFNPYDISDVDASAYYYKVFHEPVFIGNALDFEYDDLPNYLRAIRAVENEVNAGRSLRVTIKKRSGSGKVEPQTIYFPANDKSTRASMLDVLRREQLKAKADILDTMRQIPSKRVDEPLYADDGDSIKVIPDEILYFGNYGELEVARILDIDHEMINKLEAVKKQFDDVEGLAATPNAKAMTLSWSEVYNPLEPTAVNLRYAPTKDEFAKLDASERAAARYKEWKEVHTASAANRITQLGSKAAIVEPSSSQEFNTMMEVESFRRVGGFVTAAQGDYDALSFAQQIGDLNRKVKTDIHKRVDEQVTATAIAVKNDPNALAEHAALEVRLRDSWYREWDIQNQQMVVDDFFARLRNLSSDEVEMTDDILEAVSTIADRLATKRAKGSTLIVSQEFEDALDTMAAQVVAAGRIRATTLDDVMSRIDYDAHSIKSDKLRDFYRSKVGILNEFQTTQKTIASANGTTNPFRSGVWYPGPLNKEMYKYIDFVEPSSGAGALWNGRQTRIIGASTPEGLELKRQQVRDMYGDTVVIRSPNEVELQKRMAKEYDVDLAYGMRVTDSGKYRQGHLADLAPEPNAQRIEHEVQSLKRTSNAQVDELFKIIYHNEYSTLTRMLDELHLQSGASGADKFEAKESSAYNKLLNIMFNRSSTGKDSGWRQAQRSLDRQFSNMFNAVRQSVQAVLGTENRVDLGQVNDMLDHYSLPKVYTNEVSNYLVRQEAVNSEVLASVIPRVNGLAATLMLRWDYIQPVVNALSVPVLTTGEFKHLLEAMPDLSKKQAITNLTRATGVPVPGTEYQEFSNMRLLMQAAKDYWKKPELREAYANKGLLGNIAREMRDVVEMASITTGTLKDPSQLRQWTSKVTDYLARPADFSEEFSKFLAARQAELVLDGAGIVDQALRDSVMRTYVTRIIGNYTAAQRPTMFQGWGGQVIGLFQTYQFNMIQQLLRHLGTDVSRGAAMMGVQAGIFGVQSMPGFHYLNQFVAERSGDYTDFYSTTKTFLGEEMMEWTMFGGASNMIRPIVGDGIDLYNRGDLNPRTPILLPTSPAEIPAISMALNGFKTTYKMVDQIADGVPAGQAFAEALSRNGMNRPLAGLGEILAGGRVTNQGTNIVNTEDMDFWQKWVRLTGTKPLSENIAVSHFYRAEKYESARRNRLSSLGNQFKTTARSEQGLTANTYFDFMERYQSLGGDIEDFHRWSGQQAINARQSYISNVASSNNTMRGQYLQGLMGADLTSRTGAGGRPPMVFGQELPQPPVTQTAPWERVAEREEQQRQARLP